MRAIKGDYITVMDIGSSKIACMTARVTGEPTGSNKNRLAALNVVGYASVPSQGVRSGVIVDMAAAEQAMRKALDQTEKTLSSPIDRVWINASAGFPRSEYSEAEIQPGGATVTESILEELHSKALRPVQQAKKYIMHAFPMFYSADGSDLIVNPSEMRCGSLGVRMLCVTAELPPLKTLGVCVEKCHVEIGGRAVTGVVSSLGSLSESDKKTGAICLDFGAETIAIAAFYENRVVYADALSFGGELITRDIAHAFGTSVEAADSLKKHKGSCVDWLADENEMIDIPTFIDDIHEPVFETFPRYEMTKVIRLRTEEIFEKIAEKLIKDGFRPEQSRIVLTGGGAMLNGAAQCAGKILNAPVRISSVLRIAGVPNNMIGNEYSVCAGLFAYALQESFELPPEKLFSGFMQKTGISGVFSWLKQNF